MPKNNPYPLAMEVDRALNLNLNNGRFETLVTFIAGHADTHGIAKQLMQSSPKTVMSVIETGVLEKK